MPGVDLNLVLPTTGDTLSTIVSKLTTALSAVKDDLAPRITPGRLNINSALSMGGNALTNVGGVRLLGGQSTVVGTLYMDEELNIVTTAGTVKLTSNGAINVGTVGTINGNYGGVNPASVYYDTASGQYRFTTNPGVWANLVSLTATLMGSAGSVRLGVDASVVGAQAIIVAALPATGVSGLAYQASDQTLRDASTVRETTTHQFTAIDLTGNIKHGDWIRTGPVVRFNTFLELGTTTDYSSSSPGMTVTPISTVWIPISTGFKTTDRIKSVTLYSPAASTYDATIVQVNAAGGAAITNLSSGGSAAAVTQSVNTPTAPFVVPAGTSLWVRVTTQAGQTAHFTAWAATHDDIS